MFEDVTSSLIRLRHGARLSSHRRVSMFGFKSSVMINFTAFWEMLSLTFLITLLLPFISVFLVSLSAFAFLLSFTLCWVSTEHYGVSTFPSCYWSELWALQSLLGFCCPKFLYCCCVLWFFFSSPLPTPHYLKGRFNVQITGHCLILFSWVIIGVSYVVGKGMRCVFPSFFPFISPNLTNWWEGFCVKYNLFSGLCPLVTSSNYVTDSFINPPMVLCIVHLSWSTVIFISTFIDFFFCYLFCLVSGHKDLTSL